MSSEPLRVVLNGDRLNAADAPATFAADGPFTVVLDNRGAAVHVHLRFRDRLAELTAVGETNHYVDDGETHRVRVEAADVPEPVSGRLDVITGHGTDGTGVDVTLSPREGPRGVDVDESLSRPRGSEAGDGTTGYGGSDAGERSIGTLGFDSTTLLVAAFAALALAVGVAAAATLGSTVVTLGLVAVVLAVAAATYVLLN
ncbi:DUF7524 family protein [Halorarum salinum]|uniref:Uncharacterized protein n=1 Tax=Halorarum salinum TaxID=2743089 RepID=A0A7D5QFX3_9EURY|nr:hypothetical protein [Halobaculum salinum]QLG61662.1 hypothetical protein HUG12_07950 [Halobaculum salinum]